MLNLAPFPAIPPQPRPVPDLKPADFALYDALNCAAQAIDEAGPGRPAKGEAWIAAASAARSLLPAPAADALTVILAASGPDRGPEGRAELFNALDAASLAVLFAMPGARTGLLAEALPAARDAAKALLPVLPDCGAALEAILAALKEPA